MPIQEIHEPEPTPDTTWAIWILYPGVDEDDKPTKYTGVVDVLKLPNGTIKIAHHDGVVSERGGEIIRMRQEHLD
ncbi:hypothetical protein RBH26_20860 [Natronolimnohabitans sp. A-GB9]|uniref:Uncharacterized protein n=2 Tax=Natronorubrum bangense TaxID=61858 RepID=L9WKD0_9EURY|nr:hypothetical protein [Natronolimnohabitans sp. A-GB9]ELY49847.1 hypothetical protein C494_07550 [Natronorubrum bangense JCM 10635]MDQ2052896.1 hypothetical protein [Natronolimnohabitans sp. A-GB9]QCC55468.1 hypothetical protein DV706_13920 [Natronorubrum bangense]